MSHHAHGKTRSISEARDENATFAFHAVRTLLLALADLDHEYQSKLERLRQSRMPAIWQREIGETLRQAHEESRAAYIQRLNKF